MSLKRMPDFCRDRNLVTVRARPPLYIDQTAHTHYRHLGTNGSGPRFTVSELGVLSEISHPSIAQLLGIYCNGRTTSVVHEHLDLDLFAIAPLQSEIEVASIMMQIVSAIVYLLSLPTDARVADVRVASNGTVKLTLDLSGRLSTDVCYRREMHRFMVSYVEQIMTGLVRKGFYWSYDAADFLDILYAGQLPPMIHPFLHKSRSSACLQGAVRLAEREALVRLECIRYEGDRHGLRRGVAVKRVPEVEERMNHHC
ncbi:uncharacterized protein PG998_014365 [Apiospora kogelbergensis]|uniref:uncharacterized protein n=1 Tax=Apiospora kogelbergensis TaxID=1337665 RepID=UPI00312DCF38